jgi:hypothetical protein
MSAYVMPVNGSTWLDAVHWSLVHQEVMNQCDALDGVVDGLLADPRDCHFQPQTLACRPGQNTSTCLTAPQIGAVQNIYSDWRDVDNTCTRRFPSYVRIRTDVAPRRLRWLSARRREQILLSRACRQRYARDRHQLHAVHGLQHHRPEHHVRELDIRRRPCCRSDRPGSAERDEPGPPAVRRAPGQADPLRRLG